MNQYIPFNEIRDPAEDGLEVLTILREREIRAEEMFKFLQGAREFLDQKPARKHFHFPPSD